MGPSHPAGGGVAGDVSVGLGEGEAGAAGGPQALSHAVLSQHHSVQGGEDVDRGVGGAEEDVGTSQANVSNGGGEVSRRARGRVTFSAQTAGGPSAPGGAIERGRGGGGVGGGEGGPHLCACAPAGMDAVDRMYVSPEEERNAPTNKQSDVFSLGVLFFELFYAVCRAHGLQARLLLCRVECACRSCLFVWFCRLLLQGCSCLQKNACQPDNF